MCAETGLLNLVFAAFVRIIKWQTVKNTSKPFSEALILASTNPQYDKRLSIESPVQYMKTTSSEHEENMLCLQLFFFVFVLTFRTIYVHNVFSWSSENVVFMNWTGNSMNSLSSYCGLVDARIKPSDKDLPVINEIKILLQKVFHPIVTHNWCMLMHFDDIIYSVLSVMSGTLSFRVGQNIKSQKCTSI